MVAKSKFHRVTYTEAVAILRKQRKRKFENKVEWGIDLASEHERYLTKEKFKAPVIVYNYPKAIKACNVKVVNLLTVAKEKRIMTFSSKGFVISDSGPVSIVRFPIIPLTSVPSGPHIMAISAGASSVYSSSGASYLDPSPPKEQVESEIKRASRDYFMFHFDFVFACVAIARSTQATAYYLLSADCSKLNYWGAGNDDHNHIMHAKSPNTNLVQPGEVMGFAILGSLSWLLRIPVTPGIIRFHVLMFRLSLVLHQGVPPTSWFLCSPLPVRPSTILPCGGNWMDLKPSIALVLFLRGNFCLNVSGQLVAWIDVSGKFPEIVTDHELMVVAIGELSLRGAIISTCVCSL
ncbi:UNVERIFIED_CONTAM: Asparagine--tRNA ligase, cytoplasmic 3 [Sesamum calycinum]|uniref:Asparagine--tRNA ligase, cytoplasmic 3 n=1 Tax=Sesamum calycinum TaxID=2727403 RepID=A0AAW2IYQ4_9LAMI